MSDWLKVAVESKYIESFEYESFENKKVIGKGGFGTVYSAYSKDIDQTIALKILHHSSINDNEDSFHQFVREIKNITKVDHNSNIIQFFGITKEAMKDKLYNFIDFTEFSGQEKIDDRGSIPIYKSEWTKRGLVVVLKGIKYDVNGRNMDSFVKELQLLQRVSFYPKINHFYGVTEGRHLFNE
ncbi:27001_t:CDS:2 [Gigaspora margarita]|uniref:mitogen-activated protein kinase kinase n=1 Tax=Gigaspora margarita TaxID=4874 RepID=A0ABN7VCX8_GIGMA|nr:27001_t:CDS:2 [Gigaspora margarita]